MVLNSSKSNPRQCDTVLLINHPTQCSLFQTAQTNHSLLLCLKKQTHSDSTSNPSQKQTFSDRLRGRRHSCVQLLFYQDDKIFWKIADRFCDLPASCCVHPLCISISPYFSSSDFIPVHFTYHLLPLFVPFSLINENKKNCLFSDISSVSSLQIAHCIE